VNKVVVSPQTAAAVSTPMTVQPAVNISDAQFPALGSNIPIYAPKVWGPQPMATAADVLPDNRQVDFGSQHPRNAFARQPRVSQTSTAAVPAAIDWSAAGNTQVTQAVIAASNTAHLGPYAVASNPHATPLCVLQAAGAPSVQSKPVPMHQIQGGYQAKPQGYQKRMVMQGRCR